MFRNIIEILYYQKGRVCFRILCLLMLVLLLPNNVSGQFCSITYVSPSTISFSNSGGSELVEFGVDIFCEVEFFNVPTWLDCEEIMGMGLISCDSNSGAARSAIIGVGTQGYAEDFISVSQAVGTPPLDGGSISGITNNVSICYNSDPGTFTNLTSATGGSCSGPYDYQWQVSTDGTNYYNITSQTQSTYNPGTLTTTSWYRRKVSCSGEDDYSNVIKVNVYQALDGGEIQEDQHLVGFDHLPDQLTQETAPSGGSSSYTYQWQKSEDSGDNWANISGATSTSYTPGTIEQTTWYKRVVTDSGGCGSDSDIAVIQYSMMIDTTNFIYSIEPLIEENDPDDLLDLTPQQARRNVTHYDGLGRVMQEILLSASPLGKDIISPTKYDNMGRQVRNYLPYVGSGTSGVCQDPDDVINQQMAYYAIIHPGDTAYAEKVFEQSPLNRVLAQGEPGTEWQPEYDAGGDPTFQGHTIKNAWGTNSENDVLLFYVDNNELKLDTSTNRYYERYDLYKTIVKNENWNPSSSGNDSLLNTTEEYKDKLGQVLLKRTYVKDGAIITPVETYYVYDDFGLLRYVLSPKATEEITKSGSTETFPKTKSDDLIENLCYYYAYDGRKRMIEKQLPGTELIWMIYDSRDRLVLTQDGNLREKNTTSSSKWLFTKYDALNRPVLTGIYTADDDYDLSSMQEEIDNSSNSMYETYNESAQNDVFNYDNTSFPVITESDVYTVTYYDNYDFDDYSIGSYNSVKLYVESIDNTTYPKSEINYNVKGQVTGTFTKILDAGVAYQSDDMILSVNFYDSKYRLLRNYTENYLGGSDLVVNKFDFIGQLLSTRRDHYMDDSANLLTIEKQYAYDHMGRQKWVTQEIIDNSGSKGIDTISTMIYNELGELMTKNLGVNGINVLQKIDYEYNIRGWLTEINDGETGGVDNDKFGMILNYQDDLSGTGAPTAENQYNGNISAMLWKSGNDSQISSYVYDYDHLNRLTEADFYTKSGTVWTTTSNYDVDELQYDLNGNIKSLQRYGNSASLMDDLAYTYENASGKHTNMLYSIRDAVGDQSLGDFSGTADTIYNYGYDGNGNMNKDQVKGIDTIIYNYLNLPEIIIFGSEGSIDYTYDAAGVKVRKMITDTSITKRHYLGGIEYDESSSAVFTMSVIHMDEGYIDYVGGSYTPMYTLKDHLGNTRVVVTDSSSTAKVVQKNSYYPFGLEFYGQVNDGFKYTYNGKEFQDDQVGTHSLDWYDYGARFYDLAIARWITPDPLAEVNRRWSPYRYAYDNPLRFLDPDGMLEEVYINGTEAEQATKELQKSTSLTLSRDSKTGQISATGEAKAKGDKLLLEAINSKSVKVNVTASNSTTTSTGNLYIGGAFMGNAVGEVTTETTRMIGKDDPITVRSTSTIATAEQEVNPGVLGKMSTAHGKSGADMLHEVTEAYVGGKMSLKKGVSSPASGLPGSVYTKAHNRATNQSGVITERIYDAAGNQLQMTSSGGYPAGVKSADWYVRDKGGNVVVIQKLK